MSHTSSVSQLYFQYIMLTLVRAPHHVATAIAVITNNCFQLYALFSWLGSHSTLDHRKYT